MLKPLLAIAAGLTLSLSSLLAQAADVLRVTAIPDEAPTELQRKFAPRGKYLEAQTGIDTDTPIPADPVRAFHTLRGSAAVVNAVAVKP